jgi:hypothetical protein
VKLQGGKEGKMPMIKDNIFLTNGKMPKIKNPYQETLIEINGCLCVWNFSKE